MFSKNLLNLSSFVLKTTKLIPKPSFQIKTIIKSNGCPTIRSLNNNSNFSYELPELMSFDPRETQFPAMIPSKISFYFKTFVDKHFREERFTDQAKQIVSKISTHLANDNIEGIKSLVTKEAFEELSQNYKNFSSEQKSKLKVEIIDIQHCFPLGIRVSRVSEKEFEVKIVVLIEVLNDSSNAVNQKILSHIKTNEFVNEETNFKIRILEPLLENKYLCVYEFSRRYGSEGIRNWMVSRLTHYKDKDIWKLHGLFN